MTVIENGQSVFVAVRFHLQCDMEWTFLLHDHFITSQQPQQCMLPGGIISLEMEEDDLGSLAFII